MLDSCWPSVCKCDSVWYISILMWTKLIKELFFLWNQFVFVEHMESWESAGLHANQSPHRWFHWLVVPQWLKVCLSVKSLAEDFYPASCCSLGWQWFTAGTQLPTLITTPHQKKTQCYSFSICTFLLFVSLSKHRFPSFCTIQTEILPVDQNSYCGIWCHYQQFTEMTCDILYIWWMEGQRCHVRKPHWDTACGPDFLCFESIQQRPEQLWSTTFESDIFTSLIPRSSNTDILSGPSASHKDTRRYSLAAVWDAPGLQLINNANPSVVILDSHGNCSIQHSRKRNKVLRGVEVGVQRWVIHGVFTQETRSGPSPRRPGFLSCVKSQ